MPVQRQQAEAATVAASPNLIDTVRPVTDDIEYLKGVAIKADDAAVLASLAAHPNEWVRLMTAVNRNTPNWLLAILAEDDDSGWVREAAKIGLWLASDH